MVPDHHPNLRNQLQLGDCSLNQESGTTIQTKIERTPKSRSASEVSTLLLALGGLVGLFEMGSHIVPFGRGFEMVVLAQNLAEHGVYANPFGVLATGPTAANPPLYPFILSIAFLLLHSPALVALAATLGNIIANATTAMLLPRLAVVFYGRSAPGAVAAILWIFACPLLPSWDVELTVLTLIIFCLFTAATILKPRSTPFAILAGLLASALFLFNPSTLLIFSPWILWLALQHRQASRQVITYCCITFAIVILAGSAWGFRNKLQLGHFAIRTNLGMTLYSSNNDCARSSMKASELSWCYEGHHPNTSLAEAKLLSSMGEIAYNRMRTADARQWIRTHPSAFAHLTLERIRDFWFPVPWDSFFQSVVIWVITLLSIPGLVIMAHKRNPALPLVIVTLLIYPLMYYIVVSDVRYRLPVLWLSLLPAGYFLAWTWERLRA